MEQTPRRGLHAVVSPRGRVVLALVPFVLAIAAYLLASHWRHEENPQDKLLPSLAQMADAFVRHAFTADPQTDQYLLWTDTWASLWRLAQGAILAAATGLLLGLNLGLLPRLRALAGPFVIFVSMVPPLAVLPIIFIVFGVDELAKVMLIFIGLFPVIARDIALTVERLPVEQTTKALTLGASTGAVIYRIVLPQVLPRLIDVTRMSLGAGWLFLIAAEAIAATEGLGYRIFLMRRYLAMDVILPYVVWITLLGFLIDFALRGWVRWSYPWAGRTS
jgi:NitT/TauT family transport system permease protein